MLRLLQLTFVAFLAVQDGQTSLQDSEFKKAQAVFTDNPADAAANITVRKYMAFTKEDWDGAIPKLAKGADITLKALADRELAK